MADKTIKVRYEAATAQYQAAMAKMSASTREFSRNIAGAGDATDQHLKRVSRGALVASGALALGLGASAKAAVDWESSWAGVTKTVEGSKEQLAGLQSGLREMATELPATHGEIAAVAEAAGQLGVKVGDVENFTRVMIDLGETTNLSADEAATALARFSNIMGTSGADISRIGSTIVELGNNSATTEAEIVELGTRLAAAGKIAGLSEADVFAFASTLTSVGVEAEAGGTALSKVFTKIRDSVIDGGEDLETFAEVAGVSAEQFSEAFRDDAAGAISLFIAGLGQMSDEGRSTTQVFSDLKLEDQRLMRALLSTASAGDLLTDQLGMAAGAWEENNALQTEAEKRYETTAAQIEILRNKAVDLGVDMGSVVLPALNGGVSVAGDMIDAFARLPSPVQTSAVALAAVAAAGLGVVGAMGTIAPKIRDGREALNSMGAAGEFANRQLGRVGRFAMRAGAYAAAFAILGQSLSRMTNIGQPDDLTAWREEIELLARTGDGFDFGQIVTALDEIADPSVGENIGAATSRVVGFVGAFAGIEGTAERNENRIREFDSVLSEMVSGGQLDLAASAFESLMAAADEQGISLGEVEAAFPGYARALELAGAQAADGEGAVDGLTDGLSDQQTEIEATEKALEELAERLSDLGDAFGNFTDATTARDDVYARAESAAREHAENLAATHNDSLNDRVEAVRAAGAASAEALTREAQDHIEAAELTGQAATDVRRAAEDKAAAVRASADSEAEALAEGSTSWEDYIQDVKVSVGDYIAEMESQIEAQEEWRANIAAIAFRGRGDVADILAAMGPEGAEQARLFGEMTDAEFERASDLFVQTMTDAGESVGQNLEDHLRIAAAIGAAGARDTADEIAKELDVGLREVLDIAAAYGVELARTFSGIRAAQITAQLDNPFVQTSGHQLAGGGPVTYLAGGGLGAFRPRGTDTVPAMLTPGEYVQRKSAVDKYGLGFMNAVNEGRFSMNEYASMRAATIGSGSAGIDYDRLAAAIGTRGDVTLNLNGGEHDASSAVAHLAWAVA